MLITKREIAEQCAELLGKNSNNSRYDLREIILAVEQAIGTYIRNTFFESMSGEQELPSAFISTWDDVPVLEDEKRKKEYIELPAVRVTLPSDRGLVSISPAEDEDSPFILSQTGRGSLIRNHNAYGAEGIITGTVEGNRVYFRRPISTRYETVMVRLISPGSISDTESLPIPSDAQGLLVQAVVNLLQNKPAPDKVNDNRDSQ